MIKENILAVAKEGLTREVFSALEIKDKNNGLKKVVKSNAYSQYGL